MEVIQRQSLPVSERVLNAIRFLIFCEMMEICKQRYCIQFLINFDYTQNYLEDSAGW